MKQKLSTSTNQSINLFRVALFVFVGLLLLIPNENVFAQVDLEGFVFWMPSPSCTIKANCAYVELLDSTRTVIDSCCLDVNLDYSFLDLADGNYTVRVVCAKEYDGLRDGCYGLSYDGSARVTVSGGYYLRQEIQLFSWTGPPDMDCCRSCPCREILD